MCSQFIFYIQIFIQNLFLSLLSTACHGTVWHANLGFLSMGPPGQSQLPLGCLGIQPPPSSILSWALGNPFSWLEFSWLEPEDQVGSQEVFCPKLGDVALSDLCCAAWGGG